jgi:hypothetical protein
MNLAQRNGYNFKISAQVSVILEVSFFQDTVASLDKADHVVPKSGSTLVPSMCLLRLQYLQEIHVNLMNGKFVYQP